MKLWMLKEPVIVQARMLLTPEELQILVGKAAFARLNPSKGWSVSEAKVAAAIAIDGIVREFLEEKKHG